MPLLLDLPQDLQLAIFMQWYLHGWNVGFLQLLRVERTCKAFATLVRHESFWRRLDTNEIVLRRHLLPDCRPSIVQLRRLLLRMDCRASTVHLTITITDDQLGDSIAWMLYTTLSALQDAAKLRIIDLDCGINVLDAVADLLPQLLASMPRLELVCIPHRQTRFSSYPGEPEGATWHDVWPEPYKTMLVQLRQRVVARHAEIPLMCEKCKKPVESLETAESAGCAVCGVRACCAPEMELSGPCSTCSRYICWECDDNFHGCVNCDNWCGFGMHCGRCREKHFSACDECGAEHCRECYDVRTVDCEGCGNTYCFPRDGGSCARFNGGGCQSCSFA